MRAVITVIGKDRVGIIAGISRALAECEVNILDISQTIMQDMFTMIMFVDLEKARSSFADISDKLNDAGRDLGVMVTIQHEDIFNSMHRV
jgi:ACT domain-containing protein